MRAVAVAVAVLLAALSVSPSGARAGQTACPEHYLWGQSPDIVNEKIAVKTREVCFAAYGVTHSGITRTPLWAGEHLTKDNLADAKGRERANNFHPEDRLPADERAELADYSRSGYDRGHMAPAADMPSDQANSESFTLANMVPQNPNCNRGVWAGIEIAVRNLAKQEGELYVITGPLFQGSGIRQIGGRVMVPTHVYKVVYDPKRGAAAYLAENAEGAGYSTVSLSELEKISGISFFPGLPAQWREHKIDLPEPAKGKGDGGKKRKGSSRDDGIMKTLKSLIR